jgi:hypothetical protein
MNAAEPLKPPGSAGPARYWRQFAHNAFDEDQSAGDSRRGLCQLTAGFAQLLEITALAQSIELDRSQ